MPSDAKPTQRLLSIFAVQPCWMIEALAAEMQYSVASTRRFLAKVGYYSSITHNGKWYTLHTIPKFNRDGLWFSNDIGFSRFGSLTRTLVQLTARSAAGMTAEQLGEKVRCRCHSVLVRLCREGKLQRQKQGASHVYFSMDPPIAAAQRQAMRNETSAPLPAEIALLVLAECIRHPDFSLKQLADAIARRTNVTVSVAQIERLFKQHGLKKTARTTAPKP
jgi:hypothetical protein